MNFYSTLRGAARSIPGLRKLNMARVQFQMRLRHQRELPPGIVVTQVPCPLCGAETGFKIRYRPYLYSTVRIVACGACGLTFLRPMPTQEFYDRYYATRYMRDVARTQAPATLASNETYRGFSARAARIGETLMPYLERTREPNILEIGAAHGLNLAAVAGLVPSARLYEDELDRRWSGAYAAHKILNWNSRPHGTKADALILSHVVEHFVSPVEALRGIVKDLAPNGVVYIEVPNIAADAGPSLPFKLAHTMYFSYPTLLAVATKAGLENVTVKETEVISSVWRLQR